MVEITSDLDLKEWLKDKPVDWAQVIAGRAALRVMPHALTPLVNDHWVEENSLVLFRGTAIAWAARNFTTHNMGQAVHTAGAAFDAARSAAGILGNITALNAVNYAIRAALGAYAVADAARAARALDLEIRIASADVWNNISADCDRLRTASDGTTTAIHLTQEPLWLRDEPKGWLFRWESSSQRLLMLNPSYQVWIDWYNRRITGEDAAFDIPGDTGRVEDKKILIRLADATDEDFWGKGATHVNTTLHSWIDDARERVAVPPDELEPQNEEDIRALAARVASPVVVGTNNQLDVMPNAEFDGQTDHVDLAEAIAILRGVVEALLLGLPGNAPPSFAGNLSVYDKELAKSDAKPFIGVLVRMEKSISRGFHAEPDMFDALVTANFESYFAEHIEFLAHHCRDAEREAAITNVRIDEAAATGSALTNPVDNVLKAAEQLADDNLVTQRFIEALEEQKRIIDEVAMYQTSGSGTAGEPTLKTRAIFQSIGFYERILAVVSGVVTITTGLGLFITAVREAVAALIKFFI